VKIDLIKKNFTFIYVNDIILLSIKILTTPIFKTHSV